MNTLTQWNRRLRIMFAALLGGYVLQSGGCLQSDIAKRFREIAGPGFIQGLSNAVTDPTNQEAGLRQASSALLDGIGAIIQPRTPSSAGSGQGSSSGTRSTSSSSSTPSTSSGSNTGSSNGSGSTGTSSNGSTGTSSTDSSSGTTNTPGG